MKTIESVIKSMIKNTGGNPEKIVLKDYMERVNHSFAFAPQNYWLGVTIMKNPLDLAVLQQIIFDKQPNTIIECGTAYGGSAYFMACMMDLMHIDGKVVTIDHEPNQTSIYHKTDVVDINGEIAHLDVQGLQKPSHPKIQYIHADCLEAKIPKNRKSTMVVLDCHHTMTHVYQELERFSKMVTLGQYVIVEDTDARGLEGGGPANAVERFLSENKNFEVDRSREKYGISSNMGGFLVRTS
jgi:cephalosporin hydroxylase